MNIYTVSKATQGLCNYIIKQKLPSGTNGVCIAYDSRRFSREFAVQAALVIAGNGIKAYIFPDLAPTPMLSFALRRLKCAAGIVVTASHNPPEYNGYKVYWSDGGQVPYPRDCEIINEVNDITSYSSIKKAVREQAEKDGLFNMVDDDIVTDYIDQVKKQSLSSGKTLEAAASLKIVYTPLNGAGNKPVRRVLDELGFKNVYVVKQQEMPDPDFTTIGYPNPEDPKAFLLAKDLAQSIEADIIVATDPDSDRVGIMAKDSTGEYVHLSGNIVGALIAEYVLSNRKKQGVLPTNAAVVSTIVSTRMTERIAEAYGAAYFDVLTGFKWIGAKIKEFEEAASHTYVFGFEESYGYLPGSHSRDKDGVATSIVICEIAAYYKSMGQTLFEGINSLYEAYGYYLERTETITHQGIEGAELIRKMMNKLRENPPKDVNGNEVVVVSDYQNRISVNTKTGAKSALTLPVSDVMHFTLQDGSWFCARPSGTEPKIKLYFGVMDKDREKAEVKLNDLASVVMKLI